jgi:hypothetical protein
MPTYRYEALSSQGDAINGLLSAADADEARQKVRQMGYCPTAVAVDDPPKAVPSTGSFWLAVIFPLLALSLLYCVCRIYYLKHCLSETQDELNKQRLVVTIMETQQSSYRQGYNAAQNPGKSSANP